MNFQNVLHVLSYCYGKADIFKKIRILEWVCPNILDFFSQAIPVEVFIWHSFRLKFENMIFLENWVPIGKIY
jgi:hypothetical protein